MKARPFLIGLLMLAAAPSFGASVDLKIFPPDFTLTVNGRVVAPVKKTDNVRSFDLPAGSVTAVVSADGYQPLTLALNVPQTGVREEKLEKSPALLTKIGELPTGVQPKSVAFTPDGRYLLVPLLADTGIDVFTVSPFQYVKRLVPPAVAAKQGFVETGYLPSLDEIWVSQMTTGMIHIYRASDLAFKDSFSTGGVWSKVIAFSPDGQTALISNWESNSVTVFDTATRKLRGKVKTSGIPRGLAFTEDGQTFYAAIFDNGKVEKFSTVSLKPAGVLDFGDGSAMRHALVAAGKLYFSDMAQGRVLFADEATGKQQAAVKLGPNINTIALSPDNKWLFASSRGRNNPVDYTKKGPEYGRIFWVDTATYKIGGWIWGRNQPTGLAVSPDGKTVAFTDFMDNNLELYRLGGGEQ